MSLKDNTVWFSKNTSFF